MKTIMLQTDGLLCVCVDMSKYNCTGCWQDWYLYIYIKRMIWTQTLAIYSWSIAWSKFHLYSHVFQETLVTAKEMAFWVCKVPRACCQLCQVKVKCDTCIKPVGNSSTHRWCSNKNMKTDSADLAQYQFEFEWFDDLRGTLKPTRDLFSTSVSTFFFCL